MNNQQAVNQLTASWNATPDDKKMVYGKYKAEGYTEIIENQKHKSIFDNVGDSGTTNNERKSCVEVFQHMKLDFLPTKKPINFLGDDGYSKEIPDFFAVTNPLNENVYQISKGQYTPVNHIRIAELMDTLKREVRHVANIRRGAKVFAEGMTSQQEVTEGDAINNYIVVFNSHDGSSSLGVALRQERLICANQFAFIQKTAGLKLRHTSSIDGLSQQIHQIINNENNKFTSNVSDLKKLYKKELDSNGFKNLLQSTMEEIYSDRLKGYKTLRNGQKEKKTINNTLSREFHTIINNFKNEDINGEFRQSSYNILNSVTHYLTHQSGRSSNILERNRARLEGLYGGQNSRLINKTREYLLANV